MKKIYFLKLITPVFILLGWNFSATAQTTTFSATGTIVTYTVPVGVTSIGITCQGGAGGNTSSTGTGSGGHAAIMYGAFTVTPGQVLKVLVGSAGQNASNTGGGGGGSFVWDNSSSTLMIAAGGGGGASSFPTVNGFDAVTTNNGVNGGEGAGGGGVSGNGGTTPSILYYAGGGAGWLSNGNAGHGACTNAQGGSTPLTGGAGGLFGGTSGLNGNGGFGGGGGAQGRCGTVGGGGGGGYSGGGAGGDAGSGSFYSGGGGGSYNAGTAQSNSIATTLTDGQVTIAVLCAAPGTIGGNAAVCPGGTLSLTETTSGGIWSSSNPAVATIGSSSGIVNAIAPGTTTITYTVINPCGPLTTATVSVNAAASPLSSVVVCPGSSTTLTDTAAGGAWTSDNLSVATINSSGVLTGVSGGTANVTYTLPTGCYVTAPQSVNPIVPAFSVTGGGVFCSGGTGVHVRLSGSTPGVSYQLYRAGGATGTPVSGTGSAIDFGLQTAVGVYTAVATSSVTGCTNNMTGSATVTVNPLPAAIGGVTSICVGGTSALTDATPGGNWTSSNTAQATVVIGTGVVTGVFAGTPTITYTLSSTGCFITTPFIVNPNPPAIVGATSVCSGSSTTLSDIGIGTWGSSNPSIASVGSSGLVTGVGTGIAIISYTYATGCYNTLPFTVNSLPDSTNMVTGGGSFCAGGAGVHVDLSYSNSGINYQLYRNGSVLGSPLPGSNSSLDFGSETLPGTYTIRGANALTGCSDKMAGSVIVSTITPPAAHNVTGGGSYCAGGTGVSIGLNGSNAGVTYQLYNGVTPSGVAFHGTGSAFSFGTFSASGTYTVVATDSVTGCTAPMTGTAIVTVNALPVVYNVTGGGSLCAGAPGVDIALSGSDLGDSYTLMLGTVNVTSVPSSPGGPLDLGHFTTPGVYTVVAADGVTGCPNTMSGSATIVVNPTPTVYNVTGTGGYCAGGAGVHVGLSFSNTGITYQLWDGPATVGPPLGGTGGSLDFGLISTVGTYTVTALNTATGCHSNMAGSAMVSINLPPITYSLSSGGSYCGGGTGVSITTDFSESGISYQLYRGGTPVGGAMIGTGSSVNFGTFTSPGSYTAIATNTGTGCTTTLSGTAVITANAQPLSFLVGGGGTFCSGDTGVHVILLGSQVGVNYELFLGAGTTGIIVSGTGGPIDFGLQTIAGVYTVVATNVSTTCTRTMPGSATILMNPAPNAYNVIGGGVYCAGGAGLHIGVDNSNTGFSYQLYFGSALSGTAIAGSGTAIDFGPRTLTGTYTVIATNLITGCKGSMSGTATLSTSPGPGPFAISSGGSYCLHDVGIDISLPSGSQSGVAYQLMRGVTPVGSPITGTGGLVDFGDQTTPGSYTVVATDGIGCTAHMPGVAVVNIISSAIYPVTGGGGYCAGGAGVNVGLGGSVTGETYQLYNGGVSTGPALSGTGSALSFGAQTAGGAYTIVGTNALYGCHDTMAGSVTVAVNALPVVHNVTGGGAFCAGGSGEHVFLNGSATGITYQLYRAGATVGSAVPGTGTAIDFGYQSAAGTYTVVAKNASTSCADTMADSAIVVVKPLPHPYIVNMENYGNYCAADSGLHVSLAGSETSVKYQLYRGTTPVGGMKTGNGGTLDLGLQTVAGTYSVMGTDTGTTCSNNMLGSQVLNIIPLPTVHNVTGGGGYCSGGAGVHIGLDGSDPGIYYQLYDGPYTAGGVMGTGAPLDFGLQIALGNYVVVANSVITDCPNMMFGSATVMYDSLATPRVTLKAYPGNGVSVWHVDSIRAFVNNGGSSPTYQWLINGNPVPGATNESFTNHTFYNNDSVTCLVTASGPCGGNTTPKSLVLQLFNVGVHGVTLPNADVRLVPNPNKGNFTVTGNLGANVDEDMTVEVVNVVGQPVYSGKAHVQGGNIDQQIELNNPANGMYLLNLKSTTQNVVIHFVIAQ